MLDYFSVGQHELNLHQGRYYSLATDTCIDQIVCEYFILCIYIFSFHLAVNYYYITFIIRGLKWESSFERLMEMSKNLPTKFFRCFSNKSPEEESASTHDKYNTLWIFSPQNWPAEFLGPYLNKDRCQNSSSNLSDATQVTYRISDKNRDYNTL